VKLILSIIAGYGLNMHVKIVGFKCHIDVEYNFNSNEMILLKGPSGVGKSTILQAIYWCLYGNMRGIYNNTGITKKLSVTIYLDKMTIHRKKNQELLKVSIGDKEYEDKIAQSIIDSKFGNKDLWRACSYIEQKSRCSLLSGSSSDRMSLLNLLSFSGENPKEYISRISEELKSVNQKFLLDQQALTTEIELYKKELSENPISLVLSDSELEQLRLEISNMELQEKDLHQKMLEQERILGSYQYLNSQITDINKKLLCLSSEKIIPISHEEYSQKKHVLTDEIQKMENLLPLIIQYERIKDELNMVETQMIDMKTPDNLFDVTQEQIWETSRREQEYDKYSKECKSLGIEYNQEIIDNTISQLSEKLKHINHLDKYVGSYNRLITVQKQINKYNITTSEDDIKNTELMLREKSILINELKKGLELLTCPSCQASLRYQNSELVLGEGNPTTYSDIDKAEKDYGEYFNRINDMRELLFLKNTYKSISDSLKSVNLEEVQTHIQTRPDTNKLRNLISRLSKIIYVHLPEYSSQELTYIFNYNQVKDKRERLNKEINELPYPDKSSSQIRSHITDKRLELSTLETEYQKHHDVHLQSSKLSTNLYEYQTKVNELKPKLNPSVKTNYENSHQELKNKKIKIEDALWGQKCQKRSKSLEEKREKLLSLHSDVKALTKLKQKAIETECKQLEDTISNINTVLETTLPIFFTEPIELRLNLFKTLKNKKNNIKPGLNLEISYKGVKYDNINGLSGGEGDRLSLALLLALNSVSNSPIIMLDECVSSLDSNLKESCISAIKSIPNKTVICVDHEGVEGFYDCVIELK